MKKVIYSKSHEIIGFGNPNANIQFLLPNAPLLSGDETCTQEIVESNGNHWRKIFVIIAKLCCKATSWQDYRDHMLLNEVYINFSDRIPTTNGLTFVCGKKHSEYLGINDNTAPWQNIDELSRVKINKEDQPRYVVCTPYLDYRQFPNVLIDDVVQYLAEKI